jgi:hypothetical protein
MLNPNLGRVLSAVGACLLIVTLFVVWYDIDRSAAEGTTTSTGWQAFPRLRVAVLGGAILTFVSALPRQTRPVLVARTLLGLAVGALIMRRIIDIPEYSAPLHPQIGIWVAFAGAVLVALGGLVDTGRRVATAYPGLGGGGRAHALPPGGGGTGGGAAVRVTNEAESARPPRR